MLEINVAEILRSTLLRSKKCEFLANTGSSGCFTGTVLHEMFAFHDAQKGSLAEFCRLSA